MTPVYEQAIACLTCGGAPRGGMSASHSSEDVDAALVALRAEVHVLIRQRDFARVALADLLASYLDGVVVAMGLSEEQEDVVIQARRALGEQA
jgi:hypothetical protein